jgi:hypothetical protein
MTTFFEKGHVKRDKRASGVLLQPEGYPKIFIAAFCRLNCSNPYRRFADIPATGNPPKDAKDGRLKIPVGWPFRY